MIVDGAVGMVEMALDRLSEKQVPLNWMKNEKQLWFLIC